MAELESERTRHADEITALVDQRAGQAEAQAALAAERDRLLAEVQSASDLQRKAAEMSRAETDRLKSDLLSLRNALRSERERVAELMTRGDHPAAT